MIPGLRLALSWLTVLPVRAGQVDAPAARWAITLAPLVGILLGGVTVAVMAGMLGLGVPATLAGLLVVGLLALVTRGMHVDGLADTADGLGCFGPPQRALAVMRDGGIGAFAVVTLVVAVGTQAVALAALVPDRWGAVVLAVVAGRAAFSWCCRRGEPAARQDGLGALVAGSQPVGVPVCWFLGLAAAGVFVAPGRPWLGPLGVALAAAVVVALTAHTRRRFGGITGDVLGAVCETATTTVLIVCTMDVT